jgi:hypothetical protein
MIEKGLSELIKQRRARSRTSASALFDEAVNRS